MCVTVLQSQPSVSIPTLTMQRTSRPGGCSGRSLLRQLLEAFRIDGPLLVVARPVTLADGVESESHPARLVALGALDLGLRDDFRIDADRVSRAVSVPQPVEVSRRDAGGRISLGEPVVDDPGELRVLADEDENRRPLVVALLGPIPPELLPCEREQPDRVLRVLQHGFGLRVRAFPSALGGGELAHDPAPDVEVRGLLLPARVGVRELRDLDQAGLDRVREAEVAYDPREDPVRVLAGPCEVVRRRRKVDAEVDAAMLVDAVEAVDPDRRLVRELVRLLFDEPLSVLLGCLGRLLPNAVRVVRLVVQDEDVLLAADLASEKPLHELRVALDIAGLFDDDLLLLRAPVLDVHLLARIAEGELERLLGHVAPAAA